MDPMSEQSQIVTFFLTSSQPRAWLVIKQAQQESQVVEMWKGYANRWSASAWLTPGDYHCRYYCGDDQHAVYHGPAQLNGGLGDGVDGLVSVRTAPSNTMSSPLNILLVEDNPATLAASARMLRTDGYTVYAVEGYQSALSVARQHRLDLAVCDINLLDGDGCELVRELQLLQPVKAIAVTGYTLPEETEHYRDAGFNVVLRKPTPYSELASAISLLGASIIRSQPQLDGPDDHPPTSMSSQVDLSLPQ
jgi:CheY-like chemotaxis protein